MVELVDIIVITICSAIPPVLYFLILRRQNRFDQISLREGGKALLVGGTIAVLGGALLELGVMLAFYLVFGISDAESTLLLAIVFAPLAEELVKAGCVNMFKKNIDTLESGILYGAAVGFGFSATETAFYGASALMSDGFGLAMIMIGVRAITSAFAHGSFTGITGYGIAKWRRGGTGKYRWLPYYALAVVLHGTFNAVASLGEMMEVSDLMVYVSTGMIAIMVISIYILLGKRLRQLDRGSKQYYDDLKAHFAKEAQ